MSRREAEAKRVYGIFQCALGFGVAWEQLTEQHRAAWRLVVSEVEHSASKCGECGESLACVNCDEVVACSDCGELLVCPECEPKKADDGPVVDSGKGEV